MCSLGHLNRPWIVKKRRLLSFFSSSAIEELQLAFFPRADGIVLSMCTSEICEIFEGVSIGDAPRITPDSIRKIKTLYQMHTRTSQKKQTPVFERSPSVSFGHYSSKNWRFQESHSAETLHGSKELCVLRKRIYYGIRAHKLHTNHPKLRVDSAWNHPPATLNCQHSIPQRLPDSWRVGVPGVGAFEA